MVALCRVKCCGRRSECARSLCVPIHLYHLDHATGLLLYSVCHGLVSSSLIHLVTLIGLEHFADRVQLVFQNKFGKGAEHP